MKCKVTKKKIEPFMSFGSMPIANGFVKKDQFTNEFFFNMEVGFSEDLSLFQLNDHPKPDIMFNANYPFFTGSSEQMKIHFKNYADWIKKYHPNKIKNVIEIGSNDGTLLSNFNNSNIVCVGFEPSENVALEAKKKQTKTLINFFNTENVNLIKSYINSTDVICASNVICHIPDLTNLIKTIDKMLSNKGCFIFEEPYLGSMFKKTSYDQIYDEHIYMFSLHSVQKIFKLFDFELIDAIHQTTHGGSMRYVIGRKNQHNINNRVINGLDDEKDQNLDNIDSCLKFKAGCEKSKENIKNKLIKLKENEKKICGYAATSKSTTVLNYCNINTNIIDFICDTTQEKIGKYSPGTHIPIVPISHFHKNLPDFAYLFAWNHKKEIFQKEKKFTKNGGEWISHVSI